MTLSEAEWRRLERDHLKEWSRAQSLLRALQGLQVTEGCWCGMGHEQPLLSGHTSSCMRAQEAVKL